MSERFVRGKLVLDDIQTRFLAAKVDQISIRNISSATLRANFLPRHVSADLLAEFHIEPAALNGNVTHEHCFYGRLELLNALRSPCYFPLKLTDFGEFELGYLNWRYVHFNPP